MATKKTAAKSTTPTESKSAAKKSAPAKKTAANAPAKTAAARTPPSHKEIADLAHKYYQERGHSHGSHVADWLRAEKELNS